MRIMGKSPLRGAIYHLALIIVCVASFNWGIQTLTGINILSRIFAVVTINEIIIAAILTVSAVIVLWNNWAD